MQSLTDAKTTISLSHLASQMRPWNGQGTFVEYLANHYALMAMNPASIDHARHMTRQLMSDFPTLNTLIVEKLNELRRLCESVENSHV